MKRRVLGEGRRWQRDVDIWWGERPREPVFESERRLARSLAYQGYTFRLVTSAAARCWAFIDGLSSRSQLLSDPIDKELHPAAARAYINIEALAIDEEFSQLADQTKARPFVKLFGADVLQCRRTSRTSKRIG